MIAKRSTPPDTRRSFSNGWAELEYLCQKVRYWLYDRKQRTRALRYRDRLTQVLAGLPKSELAILREEGLALLHELEGQIDAAIRHRRREVELMERLQREAQSPKYSKETRTYMLRDRGAADLQDRRMILERLNATNVRHADELLRS
jgi:hypothetical protein